MCKVEDEGGGKPDKHSKKLRGQTFHHFAFKLVDIDLAELIDMIKDSLRQFILIVFQQVYQKSSTTSYIQLPAEFIRRLFVHLTDEIEH